MSTTSAERVTSARADDAKSQVWSGDPLSRGARTNAPTRAMRTTGRLMRNTEPHQKCSSSAPPTMGPRAAPTIETLAQIPMARFRSRMSENVMRMSARVAGIIVAAPTPSRARAAMSTAGDGAKAASAEAPPKISRPIANMRV
jgi:hypothetical protein